jgi:sucrose-6-phosphate hydrolase SacC (GH32 family)
MNDDDLLMATYELREKLVADRHRPRYHFCPPEGRWNDLNGMVYWMDVSNPW